MISVGSLVISAPPRVTRLTVGSAVRLQVVGEGTEDVFSGEDAEFEVTSQDNPAPVYLCEDPLEGLAVRYARAAVHLVSDRLERLDSGEWVARVPSLPGLWASGDTPSECLQEFVEATAAWVKVKVAQKHHDIPVLADIDLNVF